MSGAPYAPWSSSAWRWIAGVALLFAIVSGRVIWSAHQEWEAAQAALREQDPAAAVLHLRRAASWHVPLSPYTPRALRLLEKLRAGDGEAAGRMTQRAAQSAQSAARNAFTGPDAQDPSTALTCLAIAGWFLWMGGAAGLISWGVDATTAATARAPRMLLLMVAGFALFVLGLAWA